MGSKLNEDRGAAPIEITLRMMVISRFHHHPEGTDNSKKLIVVDLSIVSNQSGDYNSKNYGL